LNCSQTRKKIYVLENLIPLVLDEEADEEVKTEYQCQIDDDE
jgi:hypothetical protein